MPNVNSNALPAHMYRDPAQVVERAELTDMGCRACEHHAYLFGRVVCSNPNKTDNKNVPRIGTKCKWFALQVVR